MRVRRRTVWVGVVAVLVQAILFGWHHHEVTIPGGLAVPVVANPTVPPQLADDADGCEICQVLHHLSAAPVDVVAAHPPFARVTRDVTDAAAFVAEAAAPGFRARAPPPRLTLLSAD